MYFVMINRGEGKKTAPPRRRFINEIPLYVLLDKLQFNNHCKWQEECVISQFISQAIIRKTVRGGEEHRSQPSFVPYCMPHT